MPLSFLDIPSVIGTGNVMANAGVNTTQSAGTQVSPPSITSGSLGLSVNNGFTFTQASLDNAQFMQSFLKEIPLGVLGVKGTERLLPRAVSYTLLIENIELRKNKNKYIMEVTGTLKVKYDTQKVSDRFSKREFVLITEANTPYPQFVSFQVTQDKCSLLDQFNEGDELKVQFNLRGREWNGPQGVKYFNTLEAWRIEKFGAAGNQMNNAAAANTQQNAASTTSGAVFSSAIDDNEDLPF